MNAPIATLHRPPPSARKKSLFTRISLLLYRARFFVPSLFVHLIIVIVAGSYVLIKVSKEAPDFESSGPPGDLVESQPPPEQPIVDPTMQPSVAEPTVTAPTVSAITTSALTSTEFKMTALRESKVLGNTMGDAVSMAEKLGKGTGIGTGMGRAGGSMVFGTKEKTTNALVGTFYDLKQTRRSKPTNISPDEYHKIFRKFVHDNWRESVLDDYFKGPQPLYASQIMIPNMPADEGPKAFDLQEVVQPSRWLVHYKARVSPPADGVYHFVGAGDDVMVVRFNGKTVLDRCWYQQDQEWQPEKNYNYGWTGIPNGFARGDAIKVRAGQWYDVEILIGEQPGGLVFACLLMEQEDVEYQKDGKGNPILPIFRVADGAMPELKKEQTLPPYEPNGPIWKAQSVKPGGNGTGFEDFFKKG